jgi:hypothetical protein
MAHPRSYPFLRLPRTSFQSYKPTLVSATTCFASRRSLPRFPTALGRSLGVLYLNRARRPCVLASDPPTPGRLGELRDKFPEHYDVVFLVAVCRIFGLPSSRIFSTLHPPLLVLLATSRFKLRGVLSRRRVLTCRMMRGPLLLLTIWLNAAEMLRSPPLTLG